MFPEQRRHWAPRLLPLRLAPPSGMMGTMAPQLQAGVGGVEREREGQRQRPGGGACPRVVAFPGKETLPGSPPLPANPQGPIGCSPRRGRDREGTLLLIPCGRRPCHPGVRRGWWQHLWAELLDRPRDPLLISQASLAERTGTSAGRCVTLVSGARAGRSPCWSAFRCCDQNTKLKQLGGLGV